MKKILAMALSLLTATSFFNAVALSEDETMHKITYSSGENGTLKAVVRTLDAESGEYTENEVASGDMVSSDDDLVFVATPEPGFKVDEWTLSGKGEDTVEYVTVVDKTGWKYDTNTQNEAANVAKAFDCIVEAGNYWHSGYSAVRDSETGGVSVVPDIDIKTESFWITALFDEPMMISEITHICRINSDGSAYGGYVQCAKDYKVWGTVDGGETYDVALAEGVLSRSSPSQNIILAEAGYIDGIKFEIFNMQSGGAHCSISEIALTEKRVTENCLSGKLADAASEGSKEFKIDDLFTDAEVYVTFTKDFIKGDINDDGSVDINDAILLFRHSLNPGLYPLSYAGNVDFTDDRCIDICDAVLLFRHSLNPGLYPIN